MIKHKILRLQWMAHDQTQDSKIAKDGTNQIDQFHQDEGLTSPEIWKKFAETLMEVNDDIGIL